MPRRVLAYGQAMADARRADPRDDIVSRIVHAEVDGERLDDVEFGMFWLLLVVAGDETTRNALSGSVIDLGDGPRSCPGTHLARLELAAMLGELLARRPGLTVRAGVERAPSVFMNGVARLPVLG